MKKIASVISKVCLRISMFMAVSLFICVLIEVIFRTMIKLPVIWTEEGARFLFIGMIFFGAVVLTEKDQNVQLKIFSPRLSEKWKKYLYLFNCSIILMFMLLFLIGSFVMIKIDWKIPAVTIPWVRLSYLYIVSALSCMLIIIITVFYVIERVKNN